MMRKASLRARILQACVILAAVVCAVYALLLLVGVHALEDRLLNDRLLESAADVIRNHVQHARGPVNGDPEVYQDGAIPAEMRDLPSGVVNELELGDRVLHVLIREQGGHRFAVVDDESDFERIEGQLWSALAGAFVLCIGLALGLGAATARHVIRPLVKLADTVSRNRLGKDPLALGRSDEVGVLARALVLHQDEMQRFLTREQLFTGDVSHELRTPLTVMLGAAEVLATRLPDRPDLLPVVERIRRTAVEAGERVTALLLLSRSPEQLEYPRVDLPRLLAHEVERCRPLLAGKAVTLELLLGRPLDPGPRPARSWWPPLWATSSAMPASSPMRVTYACCCSSNASWWKTAAAGSRRRSGCGSSSAMCAPAIVRPARGWAWPSCSACANTCAGRSASRRRAPAGRGSP